MASPGTQAAGKMFEPVLARLRNDVGNFGAADARLVPMAYQERPFSHVLRVGMYLRETEAPARHFFVKVFKPKPDDGGVAKMRRRVEHDFAVTRHIFDAMTSADGLNVVRPIACYVDDLAIVTEEAEGETLSSYLDAHARWFPSADTMGHMMETMGRIGEWLRAFQSIDRGERRIALRELRDYIDHRLVRLVAHNVFSESRRQHVLAHLDGLAEHVPDADKTDVLVHADLAPGNILVAGRRVVVLDLAMMQRGSRFHDITRLNLQLDVLRAKPHFRTAVVEQLQTALLDGYEKSLTPERPLFRYLSMLHRVNHLATLSLKKEPLPGRAVSHLVRKLHRTWIERELATPVAGVGASR